MKGIILAAGRGSRMGNLTDDRPKGMVKLGEKMLLEWQIDALRKAGINDIIIVRGYCGHSIPFTDVHYIENKRWESSNMVVSLLTAKEFLANEICVISYADIVYTSDIVRKLVNAEGNILITYDLNWYDLWKVRFKEPLKDAETFKVDKDEILLEIGNKTDSLYDIRGQYMGLLKFTPEGWRTIEKYLGSLSEEKVDKLDMTGMLRGLIEKNIKINTVPISDPWFEVDSEDDLKLYEKYINDKDSFYYEFLVK